MKSFLFLLLGSLVTPAVMGLVGEPRGPVESSESSESGESTAPEVRPEFEALAFLVGPTWVAEFPGGGMTDTQEFEWMLGGKFLRNLHRVKSATGDVLYEGETVYAWDPEREEILWWYFNSTGGYVTGEASIDGDLVDTLGVNHGGGGQTPKVKGQLVLGEDEWSSTSYFWTEGEWRERFTMHFLPGE